MLLLLAACGPTHGAATVLTYGSPYSPAHPFSVADREWMAWVEKESGGRLKIKPYWSGGILSSDESMLELRHGVVDIGLITPIYARGGAHVLRTQAGFYGGVRDYGGQLAVYRCMQRAFAQFDHETEGLKVLAVQGGNIPGVLTRDKPVRTLEDFRGLRLRAPAELTGLLSSLGADPVSMPMAEVYSSLAKGVIDGVVAPEDTLQSLHFDEVAKHFSSARFSRGAYPARAMSLRSFERLPPDLQAVLERSIPVWEQAMQTNITRSQAAGEAYGHRVGLDFVAFDPAMQLQLDQRYNDQALAAARALETGGGTAEPIFRLAQAAVADLRAGREPQCAGAGS
jgi:TRAP-type C4-dicarboxylate transport system substrate-binding protein